jgi:hypothetical protein
MIEKRQFAGINASIDAAFGGEILVVMGEITGLLSAGSVQKRFRL